MGSAPASRSPLKAKPLNNPGDSLDAAIWHATDERAIDYLPVVFALVVVTGLEWVGYFTDVPRSARLYTAVTLARAAIAAWRLRDIRRDVPPVNSTKPG